MERANYFAGDESLQDILQSKLHPAFYGYAQGQLETFGELVANEIDQRARHTDREGEPKLLKYEKFGDDQSVIWVNEGYKQTLKETYETGIVGYLHKEIPELGQKGNYVYSFAQGYLLSQAEAGFYCPVTLTMATSYLLDHYANQEVKERFLPHVIATGEKELYEGATFLTERQGGSDVGANEVKAVEEGEHYRLFGEKYFASNAGMAGVAMVLARIEDAPSGSKGLTLFAVPWKNGDGSLNGIKIRRLKDKLGVRAVPSGEVEFEGAIGYLVGDISKGLKYMLEALNLSRICNTVASLGIMRRAYNESFAYAEKRTAFGNKLNEFPMIQDSLGRMRAKLEIELYTTFDLIEQYDRVVSGDATKEEVILNRLFIALLKKETAEQAIHFAHEAIEMHGGNGYIEDFVTPRLLRDAQVLTVWEGTANILALELIRLVNKFNVHHLFAEAMEQRLQKCEESNMKSIVHEKLGQLSEAMELFATLQKDVQTFEAKALAKEMVRLYESVIAVEIANKPHIGSLSSIYIEETWQLRKLGDKMQTCEWFKGINHDQTN
ncbi:acyl-CoA dehydrogenase family protein [Psychrobacillus sp. NPDC096623]|uniref:acyl-CoA dehydrogenase family protein n=1 Tax=Psychrobacillus sp. NPDC096623 TaxID=3364492 RepID=UPI00382110F7